jgi:hypothetical protein
MPDTFFDLLVILKNKFLFEEKQFVEYILDKYIVSPKFRENISEWIEFLTDDDKHYLKNILLSIVNKEEKDEETI